MPWTVAARIAPLAAFHHSPSPPLPKQKNSLLGFESVNTPRRGPYGFTQSRQSVVSIATIASVAKAAVEDEDEDEDDDDDHDEDEGGDDDLESQRGDDDDDDAASDTDATSPTGLSRRSFVSSVPDADTDADDDARYAGAWAGLCSATRHRCALVTTLSLPSLLAG